MFSSYLKELSAQAGFTKVASESGDVVGRLLSQKLGSDTKASFGQPKTDPTKLETNESSTPAPAKAGPEGKLEINLNKTAAASCPGGKIRSKGTGRGSGYGGGKGPVGVPIKAKNKLKALAKQAGVIRDLGASGAARRAQELGIPEEYVAPTAALGAYRAGSGAARGGIAGAGLGTSLGTGLGYGAGALLHSPRAGAAIGGVLGAAGGAAAGTGMGAARAGGQAAEDVRERMEDKMWERAMVQRHVYNQARRQAETQRLLIGDMVMRRAAELRGQPKEAGFNPFANPTVAGALIGGTGGAGVGLLTSEDRSREALLRAGIVGGAMGAVIGAGTGALSKGVAATEASAAANSERWARAGEEAFTAGRKAGIEEAKALLRSRGLM